MAFMCAVGSGVSMRSGPGLTSHSCPMVAYHCPAQMKYSLVSTHPLGRPVVPDVYSSAHSAFRDDGGTLMFAGATTASRKFVIGTHHHSVL